MAKKRVKKKKNRCLRCCFATIIITVVILAGGIGAGWYFGNKLLTEKFDVDLKGVYSIYKNFKNYSSVEKKMKNTYKAEDSDKFISSLTTALLLSPDIDTDEVIDIVGDLIAGIGDDSTTDSPTNLQLLAGDGTDEGNQDNTTTLDPTQERLLKLLQENIDVDRIKAYQTEADLKNFYLNIKDKELASFINVRLLPLIIEKLNLNETINEELAKVEGFDFSDVEIKIEELVSIPQITFYKEGDIPRISVIVKLEIHKITNQAIPALANPDAILGKNEGNDIVRNLITFGGKAGKSIVNFLIPKKIYVTADVQLDAPKNEKLTPRLSLNSTTQKDLTTIDKFLDGMIEQNTDELFANDGAVGSVLSSINDAIPLGEVIVDHTISVNAIQLALDMTLNKDSQNKLQTADIFSILSGFMGLDTETAMINKPDPKKVKFVRDENDKVVFEKDASGYYVPKMEDAEPGRETAEINEDYQSALMESFVKYYGFSNENTFDELMDALLDGEGDTTDAIGDMFDGEALKNMVDSDQGNLVITDKMLAGMIASIKDRLLEGIDNDAITTDVFEPRYVSIIENNGHNIIELGLEIKIQEVVVSMLKDQSEIVTGLLEKLLPNSMLIIIRCDVTLDKSIERYDDEFTVDNWSKQKTDNMFDTVNRVLLAFGADDFSISDIVSEATGTVTSMLDSLNETLPISLGESKIIMPDAFDAIASILEIDLEGNEIRQNLKFLINGYDDDGSYQQEYQTFLQSLEGYDPMIHFNERYAIKAEESFGDFLDKMMGGAFGDDIMGLIDSLRLAILSEGSMDPNDQEVLGVEIDARMLYRIMEHVLDEEDTDTSGSYSFSMDDIELIKMYSTLLGELGNQQEHIFAEITVKIPPEKIIEDDGTMQMNLIKSILTESIYVTLKIDMTLSENPEFVRFSEVVFNGNSEKSGEILDMLAKLGMDVEADLESVVADLEQTFIDVFTDINSSGVVELVFNGDRYDMTQIFEVIANVISTDTSEFEGAEMRVVLDCLLNDSKNQITPEYDFNNYYYEGGLYKHMTQIDDAQYIDDAYKVNFEDVLFDNFIDAYPLDGNQFTEPSQQNPKSKLAQLTDVLSGSNSGLELADILESDKLQQSIFTQYDALKGVTIDRLTLAGMIASRWDTIMTGDQQSYELKYTDIVVVGNRSFVTMAIEIPLGGDGLNLSSDLLSILTSDKILVGLIVDVTQDLDIANGEEYMDLAFDINLAGDEKSDSVMGTINKFDGGTVDFDNISNSVRSVFDDLANTSGMKFDKANSTDPSDDSGVMAMPNIFGLVHKMNYENKLDGGEDIQEALQGMHNDSIYNINKKDVVRNTIDTSYTFDLDEYLKESLEAIQSELTSGGSLETSGIKTFGISDRDLGNHVYHGSDNYGFGEIKSFTILKGTAERAVNEQDWINSYYEDETDVRRLEFETGNYIAITFLMQLSEFGINDALALKMMPSEFYATIIMPLENGAVGDFKYFRMNHMSERVQDNLFILSGLSGDGFNDALGDSPSRCNDSVNNVLGEIDVKLEAEMKKISNQFVTVDNQQMCLDSYDYIGELEDNGSIGQYEISMDYNITVPVYPPVYP